MTHQKHLLIMSLIYLGVGWLLIWFEPTKYLALCLIGLGMVIQGGLMMYSAVKGKTGDKGTRRHSDKTN